MKILVVKTPHGEAPDWVKEAWVGLALFTRGLVSEDFGEPIGVLTNTEVQTGSNVWLVPQTDAIDVLEKVNPEAAAWWRDHGFPRKGRAFTFQEHEVLILDAEETRLQWG